jgi:ABC-type polar amino acid transport system ATPase subunit
MIQLHNIYKTHVGTNDSLSNINLEIQAGEVVAIIGPSGSGKSLLLKTINMLEPPTKGEVIFKGEALTVEKKDLRKFRQKIGMVFQDFTLFEHLNVLENLTVGPINLLDIPKEQAEEQALALLKQIGLLNKAHCFSEELSGGQKQRVAIARALSMNPEIMLFDEPTSNLDPTAIGEVVEVMKALSKTGMTMVIVTHRISIVKALASKVIFIEAGRIVEQGTVDEVINHPTNSRTKDFIFQTKTFSMEIDTPEYDFIELVNGVENYAIDDNVPAEIIEKVRHIVEEIVALLPKVPGTRVELFSDRATDKLEISVFYKGNENNLLDEDSLEKVIISNMSKSVEFSYRENLNLIKVVL